MSATLNIGVGATRTYVYYPGYENVEDVIGNSGYGEITGEAWLFSFGQGYSNYSGEEMYRTFSGGISQSGLPSLNARALPIDITPIGIAFVWEVPEREYEMPVFRDNSMNAL